MHICNMEGYMHRDCGLVEKELVGRKSLLRTYLSVASKARDVVAHPPYAFPNFETAPSA